MTSFVGRAQELLDVRMLTSRHRLVTLTGPGGVGKTRLALEAVRVAVQGQVVAVDLAAVDGDVARAVLGTLGGPVRPSEEPVDSVVRFLGSRPLCLVLDNCEHVLGEASALAERIVEQCLRTTLLATSRVPLRAVDEQLYPVPAMSVLGEGSEALALYRARADRHAPRRPPDDPTLVAALCHRVDALPLGIELAAALAGTMPLPELLVSLAHGQELLAGGPRSAPSRQGSVDESLRWSTRLLEPVEREALGILSVFRGGFDLDAASVVLASEQRRGWTAQVMTRLVGNSLVAVTTGQRGARYRLLETVRAFAAAELLVDGAAVRERHLAMLVARAELIEPAFESAGLGMRIAELREDLPDIRAALAWASAGEHAEDGLRLVGALWRFWWAGARAEGRGLVEAALSVPGGSGEVRAKAQIAAVLATSAHLDLFGAIEHGIAAVEHARASGNDSLLALAQCWHGWMLGLLDPVAARPVLESAIALARRTGELTVLADSLNGLAALDVFGGDLTRGATALQEALAIAEGTGNVITRCHALALLAFTLLVRGRLDEGLAAVAEALPTARLIGDAVYTVQLLNTGAWLHALRREDDQARLLAQEAVETGRSTGDELIARAAHGGAGVAAFAAGNIAEARAALTAAVPGLSAVGLPMAVEATSLLARLCCEVPDLQEAQLWAARCYELSERASGEPAMSRAHLAAASIAHTAGDGRKAADAVQDALGAAWVARDVPAVLSALDLLCVMDAVRDLKVSIRLAAATDAARTATGLERASGDEQRWLEFLAQARRAIPETFLTSWSAGKDLSLEDAVATARRGRGPRGRPTVGWGALTPAEHRVVALIVQGLSNPDIARALFVSRETVKGHVSSALTKTGAANRTELAGLALTHHQPPP